LAQHVPARHRPNGAHLAGHPAYRAMESGRAHREDGGMDEATPRRGDPIVGTAAEGDSLRSHRERSHAVRPTPVRRQSRRRGRGPPASNGRIPLDAGTPPRTREIETAGQTPLRRVQPGTLHARAPGKEDRLHRAGRRFGDRPGARHEGVRRNVDLPRGRRRRLGSDRFRWPHQSPSRRPPVHPAKSGADERGGDRLLLRFFKRGALAPLPHRPHAAPVPRIRLGTIPIGEQEVRPGCHGRVKGDRGTLCADPGLSFRAPAPPPETRTARRTHRLVLAHPLAESRSLRHLSLAEGPPLRHARSRPHRVPHPVPLQQFPRHCGPDPRIPD